VFVPSNNTIYSSIDVYFDEHFESTIAFESNRYPGYVDCVITDAKAHEDLDVQRTGSALWISNKKRLLSGAVVQKFAHPHVKEEYDIDFHNDNTSSQDTPLPMFDQRQNTTSDDPICIDQGSVDIPRMHNLSRLGPRHHRPFWTCVLHTPFGCEGEEMRRGLHSPRISHFGSRM
jgi:hypothetical protein